jgi:signal transduction histidine kinase
LSAEQAPRERGGLLSARDEALLRIAALVAGGASSADVFAAVAREVGQVVGLPVVGVWRYEPGQTTATVIGAWGSAAHPFETGIRWPLDDRNVLAEVLSTGRPARIDDSTEIPSTTVGAIRDSGFGAAAGAPIMVAGMVWGAMTASAAGSAELPDHLEDRLAQFTKLLATAIENTASTDRLARLADEQAALRRVAMLVARGARPAEVFASVANEVTRLLSVDLVNIGRYESNHTVTLVASTAERLAVGTRWPLEETSLAPIVLRTGLPVRTEAYDRATGQFADDFRQERIRSGVATPIIVEGRLWGLMAASNSREQALPPDTEVRLTSFTELVATAIANTEARTEVAASRARIAAATEEERRRMIRDLHDGAQQRLVHTIITLKLARRAFQSESNDLPALLTEALEHAQRATDELRELVHGILPAVLTHGGLRAGVSALASRMPVPVENGVAVGRLPPAIESTAYFVVAEALTNVAKHAHARHAEVTARIEHGILAVHVKDDGVGGARADGGGLIGLADRLAALDGELRIDSPADGGTLIAADIPVRE